MVYNFSVSSHGTHWPPAHLPVHSDASQKERGKSYGTGAELEATDQSSSNNIMLIFQTPEGLGYALIDSAKRKKQQYR